MKNFPIMVFLFLNIYIILFPLIISQRDDPSISRLLACMSLLHQEANAEEMDPNIYSMKMLKCYITISDSQANNFLLSLEKGQNSLSKSEIRKLFDYDSLRDMSQNELKQKSMDLERTLKKFKKMQEDIMGGREPDDDGGDYDDYDYEDEYQRERPSNINFFSLIPKGIFGLFGVFSSYISLFIIFVLVYFLLLALRKMNDAEKKNKKKKKVKYEEEDEFDDDEYEDYKNKNNSRTRNRNKKSTKID